MRFSVPKVFFLKREECTKVKMLVALKKDLLVSKIEPVYKKQVLTYLRLTGMKLGLLVKFNEALIQDGISRILNNL